MNGRLNVTDDERAAFYAKVAIKGPDDCWLWTGATQKPGAGRQLPYAIARFRGVQMNGHRLAWSIEYDQTPPVGMVIRHTCHTAQCCNPRHLLLGTPKENAMDTSAAGRWNPTIRYGYHPRIEEPEARTMLESGFPTLAAMARHFKRSPSTIRAAFKRWGFTLPSVKRSDDEWRRIAALEFRTFAEIERHCGASIGAVKANFTRLGLPLNIVPAPKFSDDYWRAMAAENAPSVAALRDKYRHCRRVIVANFKRLGLPVPPGRHRPCGGDV